MNNILVIGFSTRNIVCSGKRAGYDMYSIDAFCDYDLMQCCVDARKLHIGESFDASLIKPEDIDELISGFGVDFDAVIAGSGFESAGLESLSYTLLGNDPEITKQVSDKYLFSAMLEKSGFPHPKTVLLSGIGNLQFPVMVKPACSGGGIFNMKIENASDVALMYDKLSALPVPDSKTKMIAQEFIPGTPASVSVISTGKKAVAIAVNEQLIGIPWLTDIPFAYCGNITPYDTPYAREMKQMAEELILELGLVGSNGVDFIISENGPVVIEVNARFQGSLDTVEMSSGVNIVNAHIKAFEGELVSFKETKNYAGRAILYAGGQILVTEEMHKKLRGMHVSDIPVAGQLIHPGEPVISILYTGRNRDDILRKMEETARALSVIFIVNR